MNIEKRSAYTMTPEEIQDRLHRFSSKRNTTALTVVSVTEFILELLAEPVVDQDDAASDQHSRECQCPACNWERSNPEPDDEMAQFVAEHGHQLARILGVTSFDIADRDSQIMEILQPEKSAWRGACEHTTANTACRICRDVHGPDYDRRTAGDGLKK